MVFGRLVLFEGSTPELSERETDPSVKGGGGGGGGSVRIEPSRQLLDDCTDTKSNKRKEAFQKSTFQKHRMTLKKNLAARRQHFDFLLSLG